MDPMALAVVKGMKPWFSEQRRIRGTTLPDMRAEAVNCRTLEQIVWDHAILAAAEYVRRRQNYDEKLALEIQQLMCVKLPKD